MCSILSIVMFVFENQCSCNAGFCYSLVVLGDDPTFDGIRHQHDVWHKAAKLTKVIAKASFVTVTNILAQL